MDVNNTHILCRPFQGTDMEPTGLQPLNECKLNSV